MELLLGAALSPLMPKLSQVFLLLVLGQVVMGQGTPGRVNRLQCQEMGETFCNSTKECIAVEDICNCTSANYTSEAGSGLSPEDFLTPLFQNSSDIEYIDCGKQHKSVATYHRKIYLLSPYYNPNNCMRHLMRAYSGHKVLHS